MKIGFLGPEGTFCEEASKIYLNKISGKNDLIPYGTVHDLLLAANLGKVREAIVPIENSIEGTLGIVTDMLVKDVSLMIKQEIIIPIYHYLIAQKGVKIKDVTDVISHPQAIEQCRQYLRKNMPKAKIHLAYSTSNAVRQVATSLGEKVIASGAIKGNVFAAIGTRNAAWLYGLKIIASKINAKENKTRFIVLAKKDSALTGKDKTSVVFSIEKDRPGGLHDILEVFAKKNINLTKIESRPSKKALGDYFFFADLTGHRQDTTIARALSEIKKKTSFFKILGSYPKAGG
jgi:prephenate dehydratase